MVITALETVCKVLPASLEAQCDTLIEKYYTMIVELLVNQYLQPAQVCEAITLCP